MDNLKSAFQKVFGSTDLARLFFAPGRINLIGEHTDYNVGHVFPAAISYGTYALAKKRSDKQLSFYSMKFEQDGIHTSSLDDLDYKEEDGWSNFPKGMIQALIKDGYTIDAGMDILFYGNIPNAAGL